MTQFRITVIGGLDTTRNCVRFQVLTRRGMMEAVRASETSVDNYFTRQYIPEDNSILHNKELYELYCEPDLVTCIKLNRLQWAGHVQRMEGTRIPKKVFKAKFEGVRSVGKPKEKMGRCGATRCCQLSALSQLEAGR
jgi:hypothetical protein